MYKYLQRDRVSFKEEIRFRLKRFSMSANTVRKWCTDLWNSFILWHLRPKCSLFLVYLPVILAVMTNKKSLEITMDTHRNQTDGIEVNHSLNPGLNLAQAAQNTDITSNYSRHVKFGHRSPSSYKTHRKCSAYIRNNSHPK